MLRAHRSYIIICLALVAAVIAWTAAGSFQGVFGGGQPLPGQEELAHVIFFDVDQGDSTLLLGPDFTIVIDAGRHDRDDVTSHLRAAGVERIDLLVGTHPHSDHIGQFPNLFREFDIAEVWLPGSMHTTRIFERTLDAILDSEAAYHEPRAGERFAFGSADVLVLHPDDALTGHLNNDSIALKITYKDIAFVFTGDGEAAAEEAILKRGYDLASHVLHLGHHGSRTSSTAAFIAAVSPEVAVYSAGVDNSYGHPHPEVLTRLQRAGIQVYGTDRHGSVRVVTDGRTYTVIPERENGPSIGSSNSNGVPAGACLPHQVNINTAPMEALTKIRHIGSARAEAIMRLRPFDDLEDLERVPGIGPARLREIVEQGIACIG